MFAHDSAIGSDHKDCIVEFTSLTVPFWLGEEHGHVESRHQLANVHHPQIGLWHDPLGADTIRKV
jgi:hypothetical protein